MIQHHIIRHNTHQHGSMSLSNYERLVNKDADDEYIKCLILHDIALDNEAHKAECLNIANEQAYLRELEEMEAEEYYLIHGHYPYDEDDLPF